MGLEDYQELRAFLARFGHRVKLLKGIEGLILILLCALLLFALGFAIQEIQPLFPYAALFYSIVTAGLLSALLSWTLLRGLRKVQEETAALYIEKKCPHLKNNLINSLQLYPQIAIERQPAGVSQPMVLALLRATRKQIQDIPVDTLTSSRRIQTQTRLFSFLLIPVAAAVFFHPTSAGKTFKLILHPFADMPSAHVALDVHPKGTRLLRGSTLAVTATTTGAEPKLVELLVSTGNADEPKKLPMEKIAPGRFAASIPEIQETLSYRVAAGPTLSSWYTIEAVDAPEVGNLRITLFPPNYTGLPSQTFPGGDADGIKGSTLHLEAATNKEILKAKIVLDGAREVPLKISGRKLTGNLVLFESHKYEIQVEDGFGFRNAPFSHEIRVRPDGFPTVELLSPREDLEVNGDETLPLEFSARDDFGIQGIALIARLGGREEKISIQRDSNKKLIPREHFIWDLGRLGIRQGDEVVYELEVLDNDTISGPKRGASAALKLRLRNLKGEHQEVAEMLRDLSREMVDLLADHLEGAPRDEKAWAGGEEPPQGNLEPKFDRMMARVEEAMRRVEKDRLSDFATWSDLGALKRNLQYTREELLQRRNQADSPEEKAGLDDEMATELERMSLLTEEVSKRLQAQEVASKAQDILKSQERLLDSLDKLQSGDKNLDSVLKEISQLANLLSSLQRNLSQLASRLPDEFLNSEAIRGLGLSEMLSQLDEIRKKLLQGDLEGAMALARELFNQLASMVASLQQAQQSSMASSMGRMQGEMMRSVNELEQIRRAQQEILVETEEANQQRVQEREEILKDKLAEFHQKAYQELAALAEIFPDEERETQGGGGDRLDEATVNNLVKNMIARLLKKDFTGLAEILAMTRKELAKRHSPQQEQKVRRGQSGLDDLQSRLTALLQEPRMASTDQQKEKLRDLSHREDNLKERTEELHQKLESLFQLFPSLDPKIVRNLKGAGSSMGTAQNRLSALDGAGAVPPERQALDLLSEAQQQAQASMEQLAQRGQLGRMPAPYIFRMGRFSPSGQLIPFPGMAQFPQFDVEGGMTGLDMEKFKLPGAEDYKVPRSFREEILESLKQGIPPQLKEQIESYFKNLTE